MREAAGEWIGAGCEAGMEDGDEFADMSLTASLPTRQPMKTGSEGSILAKHQNTPNCILIHGNSLIGKNSIRKGARKVKGNRQKK
jgi:hypothetical protein